MDPKARKFLNTVHLIEDDRRGKMIRVSCFDSEHMLENMLRYIKENGNTGHSFNIIVDPDTEENTRRFYWDGDGADSIKDISVDMFDNETNEAHMDGKDYIKLQNAGLGVTVYHGRPPYGLHPGGVRVGLNGSSRGSIDYTKTEISPEDWEDKEMNQFMKDLTKLCDSFDKALGDFMKKRGFSALR